MKVNEKNKVLYESAFIPGGEYADFTQEPNWKPSIDARDIETMCSPDGEHWIPATPLGYRDYSESRIEGLNKIISQEECVDLTDDKLHQVKMEDETIRLYDKINTDNGEFVVIGDDEDKFYVANSEDKRFYVEYLKS
jgi:hypothetical protein